MLGGEPVVEGEAAHAGRPREARDERAMGRDGAHDVAAAVEIEDRAAGPGIRRREPGAGDAGREYGLLLHVGRELETLEIADEGGHAGPHLGLGGV